MVSDMSYFITLVITSFSDYFPICWKKKSLLISERKIDISEAQEHI